MAKGRLFSRYSDATEKERSSKGGGKRGFESSTGRTSTRAIRGTPSQKQERSAARELGGRVQPGSGNQWHGKGDVKTKEVLLECKTTERESYSIKLLDLKTHKLHALKEGRIPVWQIEIRGFKVAVVDWDHYVALTQQEKEE